ncbi:hypothetical protein [Micromonospora sp. CPCC 206061]|uniref:hypothetical protein n=1 Tax=Micromonospora sp. CPCC 206061 TaxID=3122410 RepID=UPI002FF30BFA
MTQQATGATATLSAPPAPTDELHLFHYPSHSVVVRIIVVHDPKWRSVCQRHEHTPDGAHLIRSTRLFASYEEAETFVGKAASVGQVPRTNVTVSTVRHRVEPIGPRLAVKIDADNDRDGNPRRGWMIYTAGGQYLGFVNEGYNGSAALTVAGDVTELGTIDVMPRVYRDREREPYPQPL